MNHCEDCIWWEHTKGTGAEAYGGIGTGPRFGCVHWNKTETEEG